MLIGTCLYSQDSLKSSIGFHLTDKSHQYHAIDSTKWKINLIVADNAIKLPIHYYIEYNEGGVHEVTYHQLGYFNLPAIPVDSFSTIILEFCNRQKCHQYDITELTFSKSGLLHLKTYHSLELYRFSSFKQYSRFDEEWSQYQSIDQYTKENFPNYVMVKWVPWSERWYRTELPFIK